MLLILQILFVHLNDVIDYIFYDSLMVLLDFYNLKYTDWISVTSRRASHRRSAYFSFRSSTEFISRTVPAKRK